MTLCWSDDLPSFAGVRLLLEPRLDFVAQQNRIIDESSLKLHVVFGLEFNLFWAWLSMQAAYIAPYTTSISGYRTNDSNEVETWSVDANVVSGFSAGVSILDGIMAVGYGHVFYNNDQIKALDMATNGFSCADGGCNASDYGDGFLYVALQPVSAIRAAVTAAKQAKERREKPAE